MKVGLKSRSLALIRCKPGLIGEEISLSCARAHSQSQADGPPPPPQFVHSENNGSNPPALGFFFTATWRVHNCSLKADFSGSQATSVSLTQVLRVVYALSK